MLLEGLSLSYFCFSILSVEWVFFGTEYHLPTRNVGYHRYIPTKNIVDESPTTNPTPTKPQSETSVEESWYEVLVGGWWWW